MEERKETGMEQQENSYVLDSEDPTELARLIILDRAITSSMGGIMVGIPSDLVLQNVLDLACGPGGWVLDMAFKHRAYRVEVAGVDISQQMISYANARARTQQLPNASFGVMDITEPLDFSDGTFDLINARFLVGVLKGEQQWIALLKECLRLLRPGGMLRLVESDGLMVSTSRSLARLQRHLLRAMHERGYGFAMDAGDTLSVTPVLSRMLRQAGFAPHALMPWIFDFSHESPYWSEGFHLCEVTYQLAAQQHLLDSLLMDSAESMDILIRDMLIEMMQTNFCALTYGLIVCAMKPLQNSVNL
jgi:ubiquinone/menaquinone biosynthesis C-methylase UbiE